MPTPKPPSSLPLASLALLALIPQVEAQGLRSRAPSQPFEVAVRGQHLRTSGPARILSLDYDTGVVRELGPRSATARTACFDNSYDPDGLADALLYPAGYELFDWGVKRCGRSEFVDRIVIGYASRARPRMEGGPGANFTFRFYADATGHGSPGTLLKQLRFPDAFSWGKNSGLLPVYLVVELGSESFFLPDGPIGWSFENRDGETAPLLVDAVAAAGTGTENAYDVYQPGPATTTTYQGTYTLGPGGASIEPFENSLYLQVFQNDVLASVTSIPGQGNPDLLVAGPAVIGRTWHAHLDLSGLPGVCTTLVAISSGRQFGAVTPHGELIVDPTLLLREPSVGDFDTHRFRVPLEAGLLGQTLYAQGAYVDGSGLRYANGLELSVGSF